jgi:hypothetical protein
MVHLGGCRSSHRDNYELQIKPKAKTQIGFSSYSVKKLSKSSDECVYEDIYQYSRNYCFDDCFQFLINQTYGCLMKSQFSNYIDFQFDLSFLKYRICDQYLSESTNERLIKNVGNNAYQSVNQLISK